MIFVNAKRVNYLIVLGIVISIFVFRSLPDSFFNSPLHVSNCLHQEWFSKPCPGCGITRAIYHATHFEFLKSIALNPSIVFLAFCVFVEVAFRLYQTNWIALLRLRLYVLLCISIFTTYFIRLII